jgi:hypothetical protein
VAPSWAGSLKGKVTDPSGAVVPGAKVTIRSQGPPAVRTLTTDSAGAFSAEGLDPGTYTVAVDQNFVDTMHDYVKTYANRAASTENFMSLVEKHMTRPLNLENNGSMGWFFREWVYGTEIPSYKLQYSLTSAEAGKFLLTGKVRQSEVSDAFKMRVIVYADFDGKPMRLGSVGLFGSQTGPEFKILLPKKPKRILLNANHDVLASSTTVEQM